MSHAITRKEKQQAREILKPVLKAEKRLEKAAKALVIAKLALAHALVEAHVDSNTTLAAWTEGVLSGNDAVVKAIFETLTAKKSAKGPIAAASGVSVPPAKVAEPKPRTTVKSKPTAKPSPAAESVTVKKVSRTTTRSA